MIKIAIISFLFTLSSAFIPQFVYYKNPSSKIIMDGKGFGGSEATRDPNPTYYNPNDPKGKQTAIFKAETFAEYIARRNSLNSREIKGQKMRNLVRSGITENAESYANYMAKRKAQYREKFGISNSNTYDRSLEYDN